MSTTKILQTTGMIYMKRFLFIVAAVVVFGVSSRAYSSPDNEAYKADYECAHKLQEALKRNDKATIAHLISYPFEREKPLPSIKTEKDFLENWDDFFNTATISEIVDAEPGEIGWRGVQIGGGNIWFRDGKIYRINMRTSTFKEKFDTVKKKEYATLYPSAQNYKRIRYVCDTVSHHIRIQEHEDGLHYFSWKNETSMSQKPELELNGDLKYDGTGGNIQYSFKNKEYSYEIYEVHTCGEDCNTYLTVSKGGKDISKQVCK